MSRMSPLRFGSRVKFQDRWEGRVAALDVNEEWEVLNVTIKRGFLRASSVKLPLSAASGWSDGEMAFDGFTSAQAFSREVPPVAAPARTLSQETPLSLAGARLAGLLVDRIGRKATDVLIRQGVASDRESRVGVAEISFEGKTMHVAVQTERLPVYRSDDELRELARQALAKDRNLMADELRALSVDVSNGRVSLAGNARTKQAKESARRAALEVIGPMLKDDVVDDVQLEMDIGLALDRAGLQRAAQVYARSSLGQVTLFGYAPSSRALDEILRVVSRVPAVRRAQSRIEVRAENGAPAGDGAPAVAV